MFVLLILAGICFLVAVFTLTADTDPDADKMAGSRNFVVALVWGCVAGGLALLAGVVFVLRLLGDRDSPDREHGS